jgi:5,10-methylenetetrahydrofolate reductase
MSWTLRLMAEALADTGVPVLLSVAPLRSYEEADYLAHEVPEVSIPADALRAMERAGRRAARETGLDLSVGLLREGRPLVNGVLLTAAQDDAAALRPLLAAVS